MKQANEDADGASSFQPADQIPARLDIKRNDAQRLLLINDIPVLFSPLEYRVILALISHIGAPVSFETLTCAASYPGEMPCSRIALERHIDRIRLKLQTCGTEIRGVSRYGCVFLASHEGNQAG